MRTPRSTTEAEAGLYYTYYTGVQRASSWSGPLSNVVPMQQQRWYDFDPDIDVQIGYFVGSQGPEEAQQNGEVFWVAKVREVFEMGRMSCPTIMPITWCKHRSLIEHTKKKIGFLWTLCGFYEVQI